MSGLIGRIDEIIQERSLLKHPFYEMWSEGRLSIGALSGYSKEYFQLVKAVPELMSPIIDRAPENMTAELAANRQEESDHIEPWIRFAGALGVDKDALREYSGLPKTRQAVQDLFGLVGSYEGGACAMYAFEKEIPKISQIKMEGLAEFYGITGKDATEYFELHTEADIRHAASWQNILENPQSGQEQLLKAADGSLSAQNLLLDACYEEYCQ